MVSLRSAAQNPDSIQVEAERLTSQDTLKINKLIEAGVAYWKSGEDSLAKVCLERAIRLGRELPFLKGEAEARLQLVLMEMDYLSDLETAFAHLDAALEAARKIEDKGLEGQVYFRRAQLYSLGMWEHASQVKPLYTQALDIFKEIGDKTREGMVYSQLAGLEADEGKFARAIEYLLHARRLQELSGDIRTLRATIPNLGVMYLNIGLYDQALRCFQEAEKHAVELKDERVLAFLAGQQGEIYNKKGELAKAVEVLNEAEKRYLNLGGVQFLTGTYARLSDTYLKLGNEQKALEYALRADSLFSALTDGDDLLSHSSQMALGNIYLEQKRFRDVIPLANRGLEWAEYSDPILMKEASEYHRMLAVSYEFTGQAAKALHHQKRFKSMSDSLLNSEMIQRVTASSLAYDFEKAQQADKLQIQVLENRQLTQARNVSLALLLLGFVALTVVFWINRRLSRSNRALSLKNEEIRQALHKGQRIERKRVASELHDSLNTKISVIRWQLDSFEKGDLSEHNQQVLAKILDGAGEIYDDIRLISHNMAPLELEKKGFVAAVQKLAHQLEVNSGLGLSFETDLTERLPSDVEHQLYHITLELVNNVIRHAEASEVEIKLTVQDNLVELSVTDNGIGFEPGGVVTGVGLENIRSRAASIGGVSKIGQTADGGTEVIVTVLQKYPAQN